MQRTKRKHMGEIRCLLCEGSRNGNMKLNFYRIKHVVWLMHGSSSLCHEKWNRSFLCKAVLTISKVYNGKIGEATMLIGMTVREGPCPQLVRREN
jgi:hypothetical protein